MWDIWLNWWKAHPWFKSWFEKPPRCTQQRPAEQVYDDLMNAIPHEEETTRCSSCGRVIVGQCACLKKKDNKKRGTTTTTSKTRNKNKSRRNKR